LQHERLHTGVGWFHSLDSEGSGGPAFAKAKARQARGFLLRRGYSATGEIEPRFAETLLGMEIGHELIVITWLHEAKRDVLKGHPRNDPNRPLTGAAKPARAASGDRARD
jgi:hypothetical protein